MGTNCGTLLADLFLYSYDAYFTQRLLRKNEKQLGRYLNFKFLYIDDVHNNSLRLLVMLIGGVMVSVLTSRTVDRGFEPRSGQNKDNTIGICCFSAKHAALRVREQRLVGSESG